MKLLVWFVKIVLTVLLVSSLTLLTTGLIVQSYAKSLLASFNIQWEGQPMGLTAMFQGALGGKTSEGNKSGNGTTDQPTGADEEQVPEDAVSVMGNGTESGQSGVDAGNNASQGSGSGEGTGGGSGTDTTVGSNSGTSAGNGTDTGTGNDSGTDQGSGSASGNGTGAASGGVFSQAMMLLLYHRMTLQERRTSTSRGERKNLQPAHEQASAERNDRSQVPWKVA